MIFPGAVEPPGGCAHTRDSTPPKVLSVKLPPAPKFLAPVGAAAAKPGDDARLAWRRAEAAALEGDERLRRARAWYLAVRKRSGETPLK